MDLTRGKAGRRIRRIAAGVVLIGLGLSVLFWGMAHTRLDVYAWSIVVLNVAVGAVLLFR